ncbi:Elongator complex protein 6 [Yarrowia sp. C11]|nr:Elongator complex protein 6 [Yarrowia sp. E02]KAG5367504.1 Elongator complex protein 6 [Yarrowia sp. C11]
MTTFNDFGIFAGEKLIENQTFGLVTATNDVNGSWFLTQVVKRLGRHEKVTLITTINDEEFYIEALKRQGIKLQALPNVRIVSLLGKPANDVLQYADKDTVVVLENPDLWTAGGTNNVQEVVRTIFKLQQASRAVLCLIQADKPLLENADSSLLSTNHTNLGIQLLHQTDYVITLRPLPTGRADDVTGILNVSRGTRPTDIAVDEKEYLYFIKGEQVKITPR